MDGLSNCFIKNFWHFLRVPVHRYATFCIANGALTHTFRTAKIRIIPKKGDTTKIGNWRPISLLSCLYKVISRALNNRFKKTRDFTMSRAQKGFTSKRYIQEVLINVIEHIAHCKKVTYPRVYCVRPARMRSSIPLLEPGPPRFFGGMKTANKPHASRNYTQDH